MALVVGEWRFRGAAPAPAAVAARMVGAMGLDVRTGADGVEVPALRERLFDWQAGEGRLRLHGFAPAHPFLWEHLDAALAALGGAVPHGGDPTLWRPDPRRRALRRPWAELAWSERAILRLPALLMARPLDRFLA